LGSAHCKKDIFSTGLKHESYLKNRNKRKQKAVPEKFRRFISLLISMPDERYSDFLYFVHPLENP